MLTWLAWFELELDRPSRSDVYAMQTAAEVRRVLNKNVKLQDLHVPFSKPKKKKLTVEQATAASKAKWLGIIGKVKPRGD